MVGLRRHGAALGSTWGSVGLDLAGQFSWEGLVSPVNDMSMSVDRILRLGPHVHHVQFLLQY